MYEALSYSTCGYSGEISGMRICEELVKHIGLRRKREEAEYPAPECVSIRQHTSEMRRKLKIPHPLLLTTTIVSIRQHTSAHAPAVVDDYYGHGVLDGSNALERADVVEERRVADQQRHGPGERCAEAHGRRQHAVNP